MQGPLDDWFGFDVRDLIRQLDEADFTSLNLQIESPGGVIDDGLALYNDLRNRAKSGVTVAVQASGVVASAAVLPFLSGDTRAMSAGTMLMVHEPHMLGLIIGTAAEIEKEASRMVRSLQAYDRTITEVYKERTGAEAEQITKWAGRRDLVFSERSPLTPDLPQRFFPQKHMTPIPSLKRGHRRLGFFAQWRTRHLKATQLQKQG